MKNEKESFPAVRSEEVTEKQKAWNMMTERVERIVDGLEYGIDENIKETIIALNMLDIATSGSCEGHLDRGIASPWIDIEHEETQEIKSIREEFIVLNKQIIQREEKEKEKKERESPSEELEALWNKSHMLAEKLEGYNLEEMKKIMALLSEFYKERKTGYDQMLILQFKGSWVRLQSQGTELQYLAHPEEKEKTLIRYREEIQAFTDFLKNKYFQE